MVKSVIKTLNPYPYYKDEKKKIIEYMTKFDDFAVAGLVNDYFAKKELQKDNLCYSDGEFVWCTQDIYHILEYNVTIADDFFKVALEQ